MRETAPFLIYKRRETWRERGSRAIEDEVLSDRRLDASPLPFSITSFVQVSGGSRCFEERPCATGNTSILPPPFSAQTSRHQHLFAGLFSCNRSCTLLFVCHLLIYIHSCLFVSMSIRVFCVNGPCPCVSLLVRDRASLSLSFPFYHLLFSSRPR